MRALTTQQGNCHKIGLYDPFENDDGDIYLILVVLIHKRSQSPLSFSVHKNYDLQKISIHKKDHNPLSL